MNTRELRLTKRISVTMSEDLRRKAERKSKKLRIDLSEAGRLAFEMWVKCKLGDKENEA